MQANLGQRSEDDPHYKLDKDGKYLNSSFSDDN